MDRVDRPAYRPPVQGRDAGEGHRRGCGADRRDGLAARVHGHGAQLVTDVLARDLLGSADGRLARHVVTITDGFATGNRTFAVVYLGLHGVVKLALVLALLRKWVPAYPVAIAVLGAFVVYEVYRATRTGSILLPVLAASTSRSSS